MFGPVINFLLAQKKFFSGPSFQALLSTGYFADLTIVFTKLRWKKQSTHVLK